MNRILVCALLVGCSSSGSSAPAATNDSGTQPDAPATDTSPPKSYDFSAADAYLFGGAWKTEGVVVMKDGAVVWEKYAPKWNETKRHLTYSVSKSIGSALLGIAIADGVLKLSDSVCTWITKPADADATLCDTTIEHLLQMRSGLTWLEDYGDLPTESDVLQMLYGDVADMGAYVASKPRAKPAGTAWYYSSGDADLLALALKNALKAKGKDIRAYAKEKLFAPAGLSSALCEADRSGTPVFSSSCFLTPRDMAKFGQMYLDDGMVGATRVLPAGWVTYSITPAPPVATPAPRDPMKGPGDSGGSYGAAWWLNAASKTAGKETFLYPDAPVDAYSAEGHWGQKIFVVPSRKLVIARTGNDRDPVFDSGPMVGKVVAAIDLAGGGK